MVMMMRKIRDYENYMNSNIAEFQISGANFLNGTEVRLCRTVLYKLLLRC